MKIPISYPIPGTYEIHEFEMELWYRYEDGLLGYIRMAFQNEIAYRNVEFYMENGLKP